MTDKNLPQKTSAAPPAMVSKKPQGLAGLGGLTAAKNKLWLGLPPGVIIFGLASGGVFMLAVVDVIEGRYISGLIKLLPAATLAGFAWLYSK